MRRTGRNYYPAGERAKRLERSLLYNLVEQWSFWIVNGEIARLSERVDESLRKELQGQIVDLISHCFDSKSEAREFMKGHAMQSKMSMRLSIKTALRDGVDINEKWVLGSREAVLDITLVEIEDACRHTF